MIALEQTKNLTDKERGNCLATCLASIFEVEIQDVPAFEELTDPKAWKSAVKDWAASKGYLATQVRPDKYNDQHYIAIGRHKTGCRHAVVGFQGKVVHDPNSMKAGLESIESLFIFEKL